MDDSQAFVNSEQIEVDIQNKDAPQIESEQEASKGADENKESKNEVDNNQNTTGQERNQDKLRYEELPGVSSSTSEQVIGADCKSDRVSILANMEIGSIKANDDEYLKMRMDDREAYVDSEQIDDIHNNDAPQIETEQEASKGADENKESKNEVDSNQNTTDQERNQDELKYEELPGVSASTSEQATGSDCKSDRVSILANMEIGSIKANDDVYLKMRMDDREAYVNSEQIDDIHNNDAPQIETEQEASKGADENKDCKNEVDNNQSTLDQERNQDELKYEELPGVSTSTSEQVTGADSKSDQVSVLTNMEIGSIKANEPCDKPGKPSAVGQVHVDTVLLAWEPPKELYENFNYQLRYKEVKEKQKWKLHPELMASSTVTLSTLRSDTQYIFQVRMVNDEIEGPYSETSDPVQTIQSAAQQLLEFTYDVSRPDVEMPLKKIPLQENVGTRNELAKTRKLVIGEASKTHFAERTIMLVGATGTGKSTLVDGMVNYILGVNWNDKYRLTLVDLEDEEKDTDADQAVSQTQWITCYTIHPMSGSRLNYTLNIIDTPGFGDTRGIDRDKEIIDQIRTLFSREDDTGVLYIDAVCFLIKAPDARLTPTQMYIFNAIMSLFGQDIENNICMLVTFADGKRPPVLSALRAAKLPHEQYFPFNNSGLFAENTGDNVSCFSPMFWEMGCKSFQMFFNTLTKMETKSLRQTRDVLSQREQIELTMDNLLPKLDAGLNKIEELRVEIRILEDYKTQIEENSDFTYTVTETEQKQIDLPKGKHVTNCLNCHMTCHNNCAYANDEDKKHCCAMDGNGNCTQCQEHCFWDIHRNTPYIFEYVTVQKQRTYTGKLEKYRRAEGETMTRKKVVERMYDELFDLEDDIMELMDTINTCNNILREIALRPDPLSVVEHIDLLIESERLEKRPGFQARIVSLKQCRKKATIGDDVDRFTTGVTDTTKIITAQVNLPPKPPRRKQRTTGKFSLFKPFVDIMNMFQN